MGGEERGGDWCVRLSEGGEVRCDVVWWMWSRLWMCRLVRGESIVSGLGALESLDVYFCSVYFVLRR